MLTVLWFLAIARSAAQQALQHHHQLVVSVYFILPVCLSIYGCHIWYHSTLQQSVHACSISLRSAVSQSADRVAAYCLLLLRCCVLAVYCVLCAQPCCGTQQEAAVVVLMASKVRSISTRTSGVICLLTRLPLPLLPLPPLPFEDWPLSLACFFYKDAGTSVLATSARRCCMNA